jgi:hypothetical protein
MGFFSVLQHTGYYTGSPPIIAPPLARTAKKQDLSLAHTQAKQNQYPK